MSRLDTSANSNMSQISKLIVKLKNSPKTMKFSEIARILESFGYMMVTDGKTSGARVKFENAKGHTLSLHKPHPRDEVLQYVVIQVKYFLEKERLI